MGGGEMKRNKKGGWRKYGNMGERKELTEGEKKGGH